MSNDTKNTSQVTQNIGVVFDTLHVTEECRGDQPSSSQVTQKVTQKVTPKVTHVYCKGECLVAVVKDYISMNKNDMYVSTIQMGVYLVIATVMVS